MKYLVHTAFPNFIYLVFDSKIGWIYWSFDYSEDVLHDINKYGLQTAAVEDLPADLLIAYDFSKLIPNIQNIWVI